MRYYLSLFLTLLFISSGLFAAGPAEWKKAFSSKNARTTKIGSLDFHYFDKCMVPGKSKEQVIEDYLKQSQNDYTESVETRLKKAEANVAYYEEQMKEAEKKLSELEEGSPEAEEAEMELKTFRSVLERSRKTKEDLDEELKEEKAGQKEKAAKKKGEKPKQYTHEDFTTNSYDILTILKASDRMGSTVCRITGMTRPIMPSLIQIYFLTSSKMWNSLKSENDGLWPARNVCCDLKSRSILCFGPPAITNELIKTLSYAVASIYLNDVMNIGNPEGELPDVMTVGILSQASGLVNVVEPNRIFSLPCLNEKDLLLPAELLNPTRMKDPARCYYFLRQSRALVAYLQSNANFKDYLKKAKGSSSFRRDYELLSVNGDWAKNYDDFINDMPKRIFFPLTDKSLSDPGAMGKWKKGLNDEDQDAEHRKQRVKERAEKRQLHKG